MELCCPETDFLYPLKADIYYSILKQNAYGQAQKEWVYDRTIICSAKSYSSGTREDIKPDVFLQNENLLSASTKNDPRVSSIDENYAITNILISNIRDAYDNIIYKETAGPRNGKGTIYEVATVSPFISPFGSIEHFSMVWRRTESQAVGD